MGLPSQTPRIAATSRTFMRTHRRRRFRLWPVLFVGLIVAGGATGAWWLTRGDGADTGTPLGPEIASAGDQILDDPYRQTNHDGREEQTQGREASSPSANQPVTTNPVTISQGNSRVQPVDTPGTPFVLSEPRSLGESLAQTPERTAEPPRAPAATTPTQEQPPARRTTGSGSVDRAIAAALLRLDADDPVAARVILSDALADTRASEAERSRLRARLTELNQQLLFSATVVPGDPMTDTYEIVKGDRLSTIPGKLGLAIDWRLLQQINNIPDPNRIRLGQKIKIIRGPFHAVVDKSDFRLDLYQGPPDEPERWTYIRSFRVGLGEADSTPTGSFVVRRDSKLVNPFWVNPRTGERFADSDPDNPIGERWIGLDGLGQDAVKTGYGIHGTIDPGSIGQQESMGCVRMLDDDVILVYGLLIEGISRVRIVD
ncbi:MAG: L,D-transpeptidase family protein [Planctomycetota bacterium]|nr:L,D-transpeptidase family protein [Planctomycetota bacterium]